jgi:hypothetical protein
MDEPIEKQIEEAQPKGPFKMRWMRNLGAKGTVGAGCLLFVFIYSWTHRPMGPVQASTAKPQPAQVIEEKKPQPPMQAAGFTSTAPLNQGNTERGLLGSAERVGSVGQSRIAVSFHAIKVFDDNKNFCTIDLGKQPGLDQQGGMGLTGKVNNHTASLIATGAVLALIQGASLSIGYQGGGYDPRSQVIANMGSGTAQVASRILEPRANRPPTITIPEGTRINIALTKDLDTTCKGAGE